MNCYSDFCVVIEQHGEDLKYIFDTYYKLAIEATIEPDDLVAEIKKIVETNECLDAGARVSQRNLTEYSFDALENPNWEIIVPLVQIWMKRHGIEEPTVIEYNHSGDRPAPDVCGGGVIWIWQDNDIMIDTGNLRHADPCKLQEAMKVSDARKYHLVEFTTNRVVSAKVRHSTTNIDEHAAMASELIDEETDSDFFVIETDAAGEIEIRPL